MTDYARLHREALAEIDALTAEVDALIELVLYQLNDAIKAERTRGNAYRAVYIAMRMQTNHYKRNWEERGIWLNEANTEIKRLQLELLDARKKYLELGAILSKAMGNEGHIRAIK